MEGDGFDNHMEELLRPRHELATMLHAVIETWRETRRELHALIEARRETNRELLTLLIETLPETNPELLPLLERGRDLYRDREPRTALPPTIRISEHHINTNTVTSSCPVCRDDFELGEEASQLQCGHIYHPSCIFTWLGFGHTCPVCRFQMPT
jgi:hypothetical protein